MENKGNKGNKGDKGNEKRGERDWYDDWYGKQNMEWDRENEEWPGLEPEPWKDVPEWLPPLWPEDGIGEVRTGKAVGRVGRGMYDVILHVLELNDGYCMDNEKERKELTRKLLEAIRASGFYLVECSLILGKLKTEK